MLFPLGRELHRNKQESLTRDIACSDARLEKKRETLRHRSGNHALRRKVTIFGVGRGQRLEAFWTHFQLGFSQHGSAQYVKMFVFFKFKRHC